MKCLRPTLKKVPSSSRLLNGTILFFDPAMDCPGWLEISVIDMQKEDGIYDLVEVKMRVDCCTRDQNIILDGLC